MARKVNGAFVGANVFDIDVDAPTFRRTVEDGIGDVALIFDRATGSNGNGDVITHEGGGVGCQIGLPLVNQWIGKILDSTAAAGKGGNGGTGEMIIAPYVLFMPTGETELVVQVTIDLALSEMAVIGLHVRVLSTAMVELADEPMTHLGGGLYSVTIRGLPGAGLVFVFPQLDVEAAVAQMGSLEEIGFLRRVTVHHGLAENEAVPSTALASVTTGQVGVQTPAATEGLFHRNLDAALFANEDPIDSMILATWNQNINSADEFIRGWPAGGNPAYTHVDHDGAGSPDASDPARSRFEAHTRSLYALEGQPQLPIFAVSFGAFMASGKFAVELVEPPTVGCVNWYAPWPIATTEQQIRNISCLLPDFQTAASKLQMAVLIGSDASAAVGNWTVKAQTDAGSATAVPVATDASNKFWLAEISVIPFTGDGQHRVQILTSRTGAKGGIGELCILSACLYFRP